MELFFMEAQTKTQSTFLTLSEASEYLQLSKQTIYQYTHNKRIPYYKPNGRNIYFKKTDLDNYILSGLIKTKAEIESEAIRRAL